MTSWFERIKTGLKKSSNKLSDGISDIFTKRKIDTDTIDELEELLLASDVGFTATSHIIKNFTTKKMDKDATDNEIKRSLSEEIAAILKTCQKELILSETKPHIILMVGVNTQLGCSIQFPCR